MHNLQTSLPTLASTSSLRAARYAGCCIGAGRRAGFAARQAARRAGCCGHGGTARRAARRPVRLSRQVHFT